MNTLNKEITAKFFKNEEGYEKLQQRWSELVNNPETNKQLKAEHHLLYAVLRGKDWRKGFTEATNQRKLDNGYRPDYAIREALYRFRNYDQSLLKPFEGIIDKKGLDEARKWVNYSDVPLISCAYTTPNEKGVV